MKCTPLDLAPQFILAIHLFRVGFIVEDDGRPIPSIWCFFHGPCYVHLEYLTYFQPRVTGVLRYGSLTDLSGVQVHRFLV
jgi:hypothetical protein